MIGRKNKEKILRKLFIMTSVVLLFACKAKAADITIYFMPTCPHCHHAMEFLDTDKDMKALEIEKIDVTKDKANADLFFAQLKKCELTSGGVPLIVINGKCLQGYGPDTGKDIKKLLEEKK
jgi:glutaredoxin